MRLSRATARSWSRERWLLLIRSGRASAFFPSGGREGTVTAGELDRPFTEGREESYREGPPAVRMRLEKAGTPIGPNDLPIAAIALVHGATLVTHNVREFSRIQGLRLKDWDAT